jgi:aminoglycoside/choline kinase family phosphotransferase
MKTGDVIQGYELTQRLDQGGSERQFFRAIKNGHTFVVIYDQEIEPYIELYHHLFAHGIPVPKVHHYNMDEKFMVQEDLGEESLFVRSKKDKNYTRLYKPTIDVLIKLQLDGRQSTPVTHRYDREHIQWEQEYFRDYFLMQHCGISETDLAGIEHDFAALADLLLTVTKPISDYLMHRDFQSQNIYFKDGNIRVIDFQSARIGPLTYDLAALLRDAYVRIDAEQERGFVQYYVNSIHEHGIDISEADFWSAYELTCLQRNMQALGAFANLSLNKGKPHFKEFIPRGLELLEYGLKGKNFRIIENIVLSVKL